MFKKLWGKFKKYCEQNEKAHMKSSMGLNDFKSIENFELSQLPKELAEKLSIDEVDELYVLVIYNDDLTTLGFVVELIKKYCLQSSEKAYEIATNTHNKGESQVLTGEESTLAQVAALMETNARKYKFPLKCSVKRV